MQATSSKPYTQPYEYEKQKTMEELEIELEKTRSELGETKRRVTELEKNHELDETAHKTQIAALSAIIDEQNRTAEANMPKVEERAAEQAEVKTLKQRSWAALIAAGAGFVAILGVAAAVIFMVFKAAIGGGA